MLSGAWSRAKPREGARLWAVVGSGPRMQCGERDGCAVSGALRPSLFGRGSARVQLGLGLLPTSACCAARLVLCMLCALWCCRWAAAAVAGAGEQSKGTQSVQPPAPAALAGASTLALLNHRPCAQPAERARLTCHRGNRAVHRASPICLSQLPPVAGG